MDDVIRSCDYIVLVIVHGSVLCLIYSRQQVHKDFWLVEDVNSVAEKVYVFFVLPIDV